jgi:hypothetical protein
MWPRKNHREEDRVQTHAAHGAPPCACAETPDRHHDHHQGECAGGLSRTGTLDIRARRVRIRRE